MQKREHIFRGFAPHPYGTETIVVNGKEACGNWFEGTYFKHQPVMPCPVQFEKKLPDKKYEHIIIYDGFADWNMPRPIQAARVFPETVSEFTGVLDRNAVKIFEHHRLRDEGGNIGVVVWSLDHHGYFIDFGEGFELQEVDGDAYEVVGTIFDVTEQPNETDPEPVEIDNVSPSPSAPAPNNPCYGCCHYDGCQYYNDHSNKSEEERFMEHCVGCCCGDGIECNRDKGGCMNYETTPSLG